VRVLAKFGASATTECSAAGPSPSTLTPKEPILHVEAWSQPGAAAGIIDYYRASVRQSQKEAAAKLRPLAAPTLVIWASAIPTSAPTSPSPTTTTCPTSIAWSASPTRRTGCITTRQRASTNC